MNESKTEIVEKIKAQFVNYVKNILISKYNRLNVKFIDSRKSASSLMYYL